MTRSGERIQITDDLLRRAITREPGLGIAQRAAAEVAGAVEMTPQRRAALLAWPWTPALPGLAPSARRRHLSTLAAFAVLVALATAAMTVGVFIASRPHVPPPFGLARAGLVAFDVEGRVGIASADGRTIQMLTSPDQVAWQATFSPDGTLVAYWSSDDFGASTAAGLTTTRHLVVVRVPEAGTARRVVATAPGVGDWRVSWSPDSRQIAYAGPVGGAWTISRVGLDGQAPVVLDTGIDAHDPTWSPDGSMLAFIGGHFDKDRGVYVADTNGRSVRRLTTVSSRSLFHEPVWSPAGDRIAFAATGDQPSYQVWTVDRSGGSERNISNDPFDDNEYPVWSPDGTRIAWVRSGAGISGQYDHVVVADPDGSRQLVLPPPVVDAEIAWSPDGTRILAVEPDPTTGTATHVISINAHVGTVVEVAGGEFRGTPSWQRLAP